jgi:hypothetical protein
MGHGRLVFYPLVGNVAQIYAMPASTVLSGPAAHCAPRRLSRLVPIADRS